MFSATVLCGLVILGSYPFSEGSDLRDGLSSLLEWCATRLSPRRNRPLG